MIRVIAIDPGVHTGLADMVDGEFELLLETDFWGAYDYILALPDTPAVIVVEVATDSHVWHAKGKTSPAKAARTGQHVGAVRREGELLAAGLRRDGYNVKTVPPRGKIDAKFFQAYTGHAQRTNEHKRDAGMMAWAEYQAIRCRSSHPNTALGA